MSKDNDIDVVVVDRGSNKLFLTAREQTRNQEHAALKALIKLASSSKTNSFKSCVIRTNEKSSQHERTQTFPDGLHVTS